EHPLVDKITRSENKNVVQEYKDKASRKSEVDRQSATEKTGVATGAFAINPFTQKPIPIWISDYVLMGYGTGAIMAVPAHDERDFEFAKKFGLEIVRVIEGGELPYIGDGLMVNSGNYTGQPAKEALKKIIIDIEKKKLGQATVQYKL